MAVFYNAHPLTDDVIDASLTLDIAVMPGVTRQI